MDFPFFGKGCSFTDDTVMTVATADAIMHGLDFGETYRHYGAEFPHPKGGYGGRFAAWLRSDSPKPYGSYGNGSGMRVSPCALIHRHNRVQALSAAALSSMPTHNHPEGVRGAMAITDAILMAFDHRPKSAIRSAISGLYGYDLAFTSDDIRQSNTFDKTCQVTVPQAIVAFLDSDSFESAVRLAVSIGGDSDTIAAMAGGIAEAYYGVPKDIRSTALGMLPTQLASVVEEMYARAEA